VADTTPGVVSHHPEANIASGNQDIATGQDHKQAINQRVQQISDIIDQMGDVYYPVKQTWHTQTKPAMLTAWHGWADAKIAHGTKKIGSATAFVNTEQENTGIVNAAAEGNAGGTTSSGTPI
jgi:hypothetical protein